MSFLESSSNSTAPKPSTKEGRSHVSPVKHSSGVPQPSKNKWSVDLGRKEDGSTPSSRGNENIVNKPADNNANNTSTSCTYSNVNFYRGKDELELINENDKPILKLWASRSKQNSQASVNGNRNSGSRISNGASTDEDSPPPSTVPSQQDSAVSRAKNGHGNGEHPLFVKAKAKYVAAPGLTRNNTTEEQRLPDEVAKSYLNHGRSKNTSLPNGDVSLVSADASDVPVKPKTTKHKHISNTAATRDDEAVDKRSSSRGVEDAPQVLKTNAEWTNNTDARRKRDGSVHSLNRLEDRSNDITNEADKSVEKENNVKNIKSSQKRKTKSKLLEYTHLNFLKSRKSGKSREDLSSDENNVVVANRAIESVTPTACNGHLRNHDGQDTNGIENNNKDSFESGCVNNIINPVPASREALLNGCQNTDDVVNGHPHSSTPNGLISKAKQNGTLSPPPCEPVSTNSLNIRTRASFSRKDEHLRPTVSKKKKGEQLFVKSCDISLDTDSDEGENGDKEELQNATLTLLNNLKWDTRDLGSNIPAEIDSNYSHIGAKLNKNNNNVKVTTTSSVRHNSVGESRLCQHETYDEIVRNGELDMTDTNSEVDMSNHRSSLSRSSASISSHHDDKPDTNKRLIRTSATQIEKPILHSRRLSDTQVSKSNQRKYSTDSERVSNNRVDNNTGVVGSNNSVGGSSRDIGKRTYVRTQSQIRSDLQNASNSRPASLIDSNSKVKSERVRTSIIEIEEVKSNYLRQRLKEITSENNTNQLASSKSLKRYSVGANTNASDDQTETFIKSYRDRRKSTEQDHQEKVTVRHLQNKDSRLSRLSGERSNFKFSEIQQKYSNPTPSDSSTLRNSSSASPRHSNSSGYDSITGEEECHEKVSTGKSAGLCNESVKNNSSTTKRYSLPARSNSVENSEKDKSKSISPCSSLDSEPADETTMNSNKILTLPSFGSITRIQASRLSDVKELQSTFSSRRREKLRKSSKKLLFYLL